jgi:hypothetical protein
MVLANGNSSECFATAANSSYLKTFPLQVHNLGDPQGVIIFHK